MDVQEPNSGGPEFLSAEGQEVPFARPVSPPEPAGMEFPPVPAWPPSAWPPPVPRVWTVFAVLAVSMGSAIVASVTYLAVAGHLTHRPGSSDDLLQELANEPGSMLRMMALTMCVLFAIALAAGFASPEPWRKRLGLNVPRLSLIQLAAGALGAICVGMVLTMLDALGVVPRSDTLEALSETVAGLLGTELLPALLVIGIMPGIAEELLFRGYVQRRLTERWGARWSIGTTAVLFGLYHLDPVQGVFAAVMGVFLGFLAERAGSIVPAMIAHAANNTFGVLVSRGIEGFDNVAWPVALLIIAVVTFLLCLRQFGPALPEACDPEPPPPEVQT